MDRASATGAAPVTSSERIGEMDVLRGFALLGVLIANIVWWTAWKFSTPVEQVDRGPLFGPTLFERFLDGQFNGSSPTRRTRSVRLSCSGWASGSRWNGSKVAAR